MINKYGVDLSKIKIGDTITFCGKEVIAIKDMLYPHSMITSHKAKNTKYKDQFAPADLDRGLGCYVEKPAAAIVDDFLEGMVTQ